MHHCDQQQAQRVNQEVTLTALDLLACIIASFSALFGHLDALTVNHASTRLGVPTTGEAQSHAQVIMHRLPGPITSPPLIVVGNRSVWTQIVRYIVPGTSVAVAVEDGVNDLASL